MKLKDKYTFYIKNQKPISLRAISIVILVTIIAIAILSIFDNNKRNNYTYSPVMENASFKATFVGDVMMGRYVEEKCKKYGYESVFEKTSYLWDKSDYVLCNLENAIIDDVKQYKENKSQRIVYSAKSDAVKALKNAGFNMVSMATNHSMDKWETGALHAIEFWKNQENVLTAGMYSSNPISH